LQFARPALACIEREVVQNGHLFLIRPIAVREARCFARLMGWLAYAAVAAVFVVMNQREQATVARPFDFWRITGLLLCFVWPFVMLGVILSLVAEGRSNSRATI
jgi:hypothetical protein